MRDSYFSDCVAPHVPTSDLVAVRLDFYDRTSPSWFERMNTTELAVTVVGGILLVGIAALVIRKLWPSIMAFQGLVKRLAVRVVTASAASQFIIILVMAVMMLGWMFRYEYPFPDKPIRMNRFTGTLETYRVERGWQKTER